MSDIFEEIVGLDKIIHEPARLAKLTALSSCISADFTFFATSDWVDARKSFRSLNKTGRSEINQNQ